MTALSLDPPLGSPGQAEQPAGTPQPAGAPQPAGTPQQAGAPQPAGTPQQVAEIPSFADLAKTSPWLATIPGLPEATVRWEQELPPVRARLDRLAHSLARPTLHPSGFSRIGVLFGRSVAAGGRYLGELPAGIWRRLVFGEELRPARERVMVHANTVIRKSGPSLVKLGQFAATAQGILPDELVAGFSWCRDDVPPLDPDEMRQVILEELGSPPESVFAEFDEEPLAAASIAQAHRAVTLDGRQVIVKVQRPGLEEAFTRDLRAMALIAFALEHGSDTARLANPSGFVDLFARLVLQEIDFRLEACNMVELGLAAEHAEAGFVVFPRPLPALVTRRVLVMEKLDGVPYTDAEWSSVDAERRSQLLRLVIAGVLEHTLVYGVFHGDLHAGNVLATPDGQLGLVDYGIVGRITEPERLALIRFMIGFAMEDTRAQLAAMVEFGAIPPEADLDAMASKIDAVTPEGEPVTQENLGSALGAVIRVLTSEGFRLPTPLVLFFKNLLYLIGFAAAVAPDADLLGEIGPIFQYFRSKYGSILDEIVSPPAAG